MFEISWSELLILGIVTLVFVGPKELPAFMRTLGRYAGVVRRQATEFRAQFDAAMREAEMEDMRREFEQMQTSINSEIMDTKSSIEQAAQEPERNANANPAHVQLEVQAGAALSANTTNPPMPAPPAGAEPAVRS